MNKLSKILLAVLGGCNQVMNFFIPVAVAFLLINTSTIPMSSTNSAVLLAVAFAASVFRGIKLIIE